MNTAEIELVKKAIMHEMEGYEFYKLTASKATSEDTRNALLTIANEELQHKEWLKDLLNAQTMDGNNFDFASVTSPKDALSYQWNHTQCKNIELAVSVFGIAMDMEADAIKFYQDSHDNSVDPRIREMFQKLISWERNHYELFAKEYAIVKEDWWSDQGFAPF